MRIAAFTFCLAAFTVACSPDHPPNWSTGAELRLTPLPSELVVEWGEPLDDRGLDRLEVWVNGDEYQSLDPTRRSTSIPGLAELETVEVTVTPYDNAGNAGVAVSASIVIPDATAPTWPEQPTLTIGFHEILYDAPATTEEELLRRERTEGVGVMWPEASDSSPGGIDHYLIVDGVEEIGTVAGDADARSFSWETESTEGTVHVVAIDGAGNRSERLTYEWQHPGTRTAEIENVATETGVMRLLGSDNTASIFGGSGATISDSDLEALIGNGEFGSGGLGIGGALQQQGGIGGTVAPDNPAGDSDEE